MNDQLDQSFASEKVNNILMFVRRNIKTLDNQMYKDLGFCIKSIA